MPVLGKAVLTRPTAASALSAQPAFAKAEAILGCGADVLDAAARGSTGKPFPDRGTRLETRVPEPPSRKLSTATESRKAILMCRVLAGLPAGAVYIGRGSKWGNPFRIGPDGDRAAVIAKYERWLADQRHLLRSLHELRGCDLVCFCAPQPCHGDLLMRLANAARDARIAWWRGVNAAA